MSLSADQIISPRGGPTPRASNAGKKARVEESRIKVVVRKRPISKKEVDAGGGALALCGRTQQAEAAASEPNNP